MMLSATTAVEATLGITYVFLLCFAAVSDIRSLRIPNWISLALIMLFVASLLLPWQPRQPLQHLLVGAAVLGGGLILYSQGWFGAGDVKLLAATALWLGPEKLYELLILTGLFGGLLALVVLAARRLSKLYGLDLTALHKFIPGWIEKGVCPYGLAIAGAGLFIGPLPT